ncbi:MAG: hypothetical protein K2X62_11945 [Beijerinckiaceae bacterium]|nr:hypothetical protein [Beijerinckiaceae bacterium]
MKRDYSALVNLTLELSAYDGYLDSHRIIERNELEGKYRKAKQDFVYHLLKEGHSAEDSASSVSDELAEISAMSDPGWEPVYNEIREDILAQIKRDAAKKPWQRTVRYFAPVIVGFVLAVAYFGTYFYNIIPISAPLETRAGLTQRADALAKVLRYDEWNNTRRGGFIKGLLLWPIEPSEPELRGAKEIAGITFAGAKALEQKREACLENLSGSGGEVSDGGVALLGVVATHLRDKSTKWQTPAVMTILDPIRTAYPCRRP